MGEQLDGHGILELGKHRLEARSVRVSVEPRARADGTDGWAISVDAEAMHAAHGLVRYHLRALGERMEAVPDRVLTLRQESSWIGERDDDDDPEDHETYFFLGEFDNAITDTRVRLAIDDGSEIALEVDGRIDLGYWGEAVSPYRVHLRAPLSQEEHGRLEALHSELLESASRPSARALAEALLDELLARELLALSGNQVKARESVLAYLTELLTPGPDPDDVVALISVNLPNVTGVEDLYGSDEDLAAAVAAIGAIEHRR